MEQNKMETIVQAKTTKSERKQTRMQGLKKPIREFMQKHYTDERLAQLLAHAQDGKLSYWSCCCFIGIPTAVHSGGQLVDETKSHLNKKKLYPDFYLTLGEWEARDLGNAFNQVAKTALTQHINHLEGLASLKEEAEEEYSRSKVA